MSLYSDKVPWRVRVFLQRCGYALRYIRSAFRLSPRLLSYAHENLSLFQGWHPRECPICGFSGHFKAFGFPPRYDAQCGNCGSLERHRLLFLRCVASGRLDDCETLLHFASEPVLRGILKGRIKNYITASLDPTDADRVLNIEKIDLESSAVDAVICNHVFEHVDDTKALAEIHRILKPGGTLYCTIPIIEGCSETYENTAVQDSHQRMLHFGQEDHARYFGRDFRDRVSRAGFSLEEFTAFGEEVVTYGLVPGEKVFLCHKPAAK